jgi:adenylate cyclase
MNITKTYVNLTGPVMVGLVYFTLARVYASATSKALEQNMVRTATDRTGELRATLLLIRFDTRRIVVPHGVLEKIRLRLKRTGTLRKSVEVLSGTQKGIWGLFENTIAVSWVADAADEHMMEAVQADVAAVLEALPLLLRRHFVNAAHAVSHFVHSGLISGGDAARAGWRAIFAEALLEWDRKLAGRM